MKGRLNLFQAAMLRWRALHPYSAVHVVRVEEPFDRERLAACIADQLSFSGLCGLVLDHARLRYEYRGGPPMFELDVTGGRHDDDAALCDEIERQLNRPFPRDGKIDPFRFFVLSGGDAFRLGLAYDHFIAGGDSIVALLNDIVDRYQGQDVSGAPPALYPPTFRRLFRRNVSRFARNIGWLPRTAASWRRGLRPRYRDVEDGHNHFALATIDAAGMASLVATAKRWNVTFNDLLLAIMLHTMARLAPGRATARRRAELAVASIVNLRRELGLETRDAFGQFLSSMRIAHAMPEEATLEQVARDVHAETARIKTQKLFLQTLVAVRLNAIIWMFLNAHRRQRLYAKAYPVLAGLTALNINALWRGRDGHPLPSDYVRAVPTGPVAPIVIAASTCGTTLQLGFSYRRSAFDRADIARIVEAVTESIRSLR